MNISHTSGNPTFDDASFSVFSENDFAEAWDEITQWPDYAPTPLYSLPSLAQELGVGVIHYKHEGPRFGLGSFKALGGAYGAQRALRRILSETTGSEVTLADVRNVVYAEKPPRSPSHRQRMEITVDRWHGDASVSERGAEFISMQKSVQAVNRRFAILAPPSFALMATMTLRLPFAGKRRWQTTGALSRIRPGMGTKKRREM